MPILFGHKSASFESGTHLLLLSDSTGETEIYTPAVYRSFVAFDAMLRKEKAVPRNVRGPGGYVPFAIRWQHTDKDCQYQFCTFSSLNGYVDVLGDPLPLDTILPPRSSAPAPPRDAPARPPPPAITSTIASTGFEFLTADRLRMANEMVWDRFEREMRHRERRRNEREDRALVTTRTTRFTTHHQRPSFNRDKRPRPAQTDIAPAHQKTKKSRVEKPTKDKTSAGATKSSRSKKGSASASGSTTITTTATADPVPSTSTPSTSAPSASTTTPAPATTETSTPNDVSMEEQLIDFD
ncbi:hypothetical protein BC835DRAFT_1307581 [Cytidiella melzeri]|nr:hypothetical protein BC835DRAFT_1307581 [Cytidiella melzeri]